MTKPEGPPGGPLINDGQADLADVQQWLQDKLAQIQAWDRPPLRVVELPPPPPELEVLSVQENIIRAKGPLHTRLGTTVSLSEDSQGLILDVNRDGNNAIVQIITLGNNNLNPGDIIKSNEQPLTIPASESIVGQIIDPLGRILRGNNGTKKIEVSENMPLFREAPTMLERDDVNRPLHTGIKSIDLLFPIGRGQRELIVGDRGTGKTAIAIDTIIAQHDQDVHCVYVVIGKKRREIDEIIGRLENTGAMRYTTVIVAYADSNDGLKYIAPYSGMAIAEWYMHQGKDALIVFDDLSLHAKAYRKVATDLGFPRGREAYPGDMFSKHSTLLERAAQLKGANGEHGGSITALPILTTEGDVTAYIPTNVISITDGQLFTLMDVANKGIWPAIDVVNSVSRIGSEAQPEVIRTVTKKLLEELTAYYGLSGLDISQINDPKSLALYNRGIRLQELLIQPQYETISFPCQAITMFAVMNGFLDTIPVEDIQEHVRNLLLFIQHQYPEFIGDIVSGQETLNPKKDNSAATLTRILQSYSNAV